MKKEIKLMAFPQSTGLWERFRQVGLNEVMRRMDGELESELVAWQAAYDDQFRKYPFSFDWDAFNGRGRELAARIQAALPDHIQIQYVESDDRSAVLP